MFNTPSFLGQFQQRVIGPTDTVNYSRIVTQSYPLTTIQMEPMVGFKILCTDTYANAYDSVTRLRQIDSILPSVLKGSGCFLRETRRSFMDNGIWVISFPVPISQVSIQINNILQVVKILEANAGIVPTGIFDVSVSGRSTPMDFSVRLHNVILPQKYKAMRVVMQTNYANCEYGYYYYINDQYIILRSRYDLRNAEMVGDVYETMRDHMDTLSLKLSAIYR